MTTVIHLKPDASYCGVRRLSGPGATFDSGVELPVHWSAGLHIQEHLNRTQSNCRFSCFTTETEARSTTKQDIIAVRLGLITGAGAAYSRQEWRFYVEQRNSVQYNNGVRKYEFLAADFSSLLRQADVTAIPRGVQAGVGVIPGDTGGPPQTTLKGPQGYMLSDLLRALMPDGCSYLLNVPDQLVERLPEQGDGLELLTSFLNSIGAYHYWDMNKLVIEGHEHASSLVSLVLTDSNVLEVRQEMGQRRQAVDSVVIERPSDYNDNENSALPPDRGKDIVNGNGSILRPGEALTEDDIGSEFTLYRIHENWTPPQAYVYEDPGPIMYAFDNPRYNIAGYTEVQLLHLLKFYPGQVRMAPPLAWTEQAVDGPEGFKRYFIVPVIAYKVEDSNLDFVDIYVVSASGNLSGGQYTKFSRPIAGVPVLLRGRDTGVTISGTTNADGYARIPTGGVRDRWYAEAYTTDDTYLANVNSAWTSGHPYDDDPLNDEIGPSNIAVTEDTWQIQPQRVDFVLTWKTGRGEPGDSIEGTDGLANVYKGVGGGRFGAADGNTLTIGEFNDLDVDSANVTTELQGSVLAEKIIDRSEEELDIVVASIPFGGLSTARGQVLKIALSQDDELNVDTRVVTRDIRCNGVSILESCSSGHDTFNSELSREYANKFKVENVQVRQAEVAKKVQNMLDRIRAQFGDSSEKTGF